MKTRVPRLTDRVAIVTGASAGIGFETSLALAREGARLVLVGRNATRLAQVAAAVVDASLPGAPSPLVLSLEVHQEADMRRMADDALAAFGRIDVLVHSAGILRAPGSQLRTVAQMPLPDWETVVATNLRGTFLANRAVLPAMIRQRSGNIVNLSSMSGRVGLAFDAPYCASKFGVCGLTEAVADEVRGYGVRVQALLPGTFETGVWSQAGPLPPPKNLPPASRVADAIVQLLALPMDVQWGSPVIEPRYSEASVGWRGLRSGAARALRPGGAASGAGINVPSTAAAAATTEQRPMSSVQAETETMAGKVVIITGGTGGIGLATAHAVVADGGSAVICDVNQERIDQCVAEVSKTNADRVLGIRLDVRLEEDAKRMTEETLARFGRIDALVAAAGILRKRGTPPKQLVKVTLDEWDDVIDINLKGIFLTNRAVLPTMIKQRAGTIINVSSVSGLHGRAHDGPYCASKFGVIGLTQSIADEVRTYGVKALAIMPDAIDTPMWQQNHPIPPPGDSLPPERVAGLILFLLKQPEDTILVGTVIAPLGSRRRKLGEKAPTE